jgi:uncharacterized protein (DUF2141 family)
MWLVILSILVAVSAANSQQTDKQGKLVVNITNIRESKGAVHIALYDDPVTFMQEEGICAGKVILLTTMAPVQWTFTGLAYRRYALAVFHDANNNGVLDKNMLGIPKEPYAFAVQEPSKWRDPTFEEISFTMAEPQKKINLSLAYWKER